MIVIASPLTEPSLSNVTELLTNRNDDAIHRAIHTLMISNIVISVTQTAGILERERERESSINSVEITRKKNVQQK